MQQSKTYLKLVKEAREGLSFSELEQLARDNIRWGKGVDPTPSPYVCKKTGSNGKDKFLPKVVAFSKPKSDAKTTKFSEKGNTIWLPTQSTFDDAVALAECAMDIMSESKVSFAPASTHDELRDLAIKRFESLVPACPEGR